MSIFGKKKQDQKEGIEKQIRDAIKGKSGLEERFNRDVEWYQGRRTYFMDLEDFKYIETKNYDLLVVRMESRSSHGGGGISWASIIDLYMTDKSVGKTRKIGLMYLPKRDGFDSKKDITELFGSRRIDVKLADDHLLEVSVLDNKGNPIEKVPDPDYCWAPGMIQHHPDEYIRTIVQVDLLKKNYSER